MHAALLPLLMMLAPAAAPVPLAAHRWHDRVLILFAPIAADPQLMRQDQLLATDPAALADRDLLIVRVVGDQATGIADAAPALRTRYDVPAAGFALRLIGKDGRVAIARDTPIMPSDLFAAIDAMPMRRDELRRAVPPPAGDR